MTDSPVEYNVVINGILPGHKAGEVADAVAPILGLLPEDARQLFNGVANTVLQRADLSAAASFQARLKAIGVDASVGVFEDRTRKPAPAAEQEAPAAPVEEQPAPAPAPEPPPAAPEKAQTETAPETDTAAPAMDFVAEPEAAEEQPSNAPNAESGFDPEADVELDISLIEGAATTPADAEPEDIFDAFDKQAAAQEDARQAADEAAKQAEPSPEPAPEPAPEMDLDALFDGGDDTIPEPVPAPEPPAAEPPPLSMAVEPDEQPSAPDSHAAVTEEVTAVDTGVDAARSLDATPLQDATPGSNMLCPSCNTLQPRADQCPGCGAVINASPTETSSVKRKLPARLPPVSIGAAAGAAVASTGIWLALGRTVDFDTGFFASITGLVVGLACGLTGGRGTKAAATSAALTLVAILAATLFLPKTVITEQPAPPQPDPAEVWDEAQAPQRFKQAVSDAESFMTFDGSAAAVRRFMVENRYTLARNSQDVPQGDLQHFYDVDAPDLTWIVENQPDFETWSQRMRGHLSGRQRVALNVSTPLLEPAPTGPTTLQLAFMLLGLSLAYGLGQFGLRKG